MQLRFSTHPDMEELEAYALGRLQGNALDSVEEHLLLCEECRSSLDEIEMEIRLLRIVLREAPVTLPIQ